MMKKINIEEQQQLIISDAAWLFPEQQSEWARQDWC